MDFISAENDSPIEQVRLTVPIADDTSLPTLTLRPWFLGLTTCSILSFVNALLQYRQTQVYIPLTIVQIVILPVGKLMAKTLPTKPTRIPGTNFKLSLNPGPFNMKEHYLTMILTATGSTVPFVTGLMTQMKVFYHRDFNPLGAFLLNQSTQILGYGFAVMFKKLLVESPYMWWPSALVDLSFYRTLHEVEERPKGQLTRLQFFVVVSISSFAYYLVPNYLFPSITSLSMVCWIWKKSVVAQQIGSARNGLGIGSFSLDWANISSFGSPIAYPISAMVNKMVGFILILCVITPIAYWTNLYDAKRFPLFSGDLFDYNGHKYKISRILNKKNLSFDEQAYDNYSKIYLSIFYALCIGSEFSAVTSTLTNAVLCYWRSKWHQADGARKDGKVKSDIHNRMMEKYDPIPQWWFYVIIFSMLGLAIFISEGLGKQFQLPFWGILLGCALSIILIFPIGVIYATANVVLIINTLPDLMIGYLYPGKPIANMVFKAYGLGCVYHALGLLRELKLGHYMKVPPRNVVIALIVGKLLTDTIAFGTTWWILSTVPNICNTAKLPKGSPWTCPVENIVYSASGIWGVAGPSRMFAPYGTYAKLYYFFLVGILATVAVWLMSQIFPEKKWIRLINVPVILGATSFMPAYRAVHYWSWFVVGFLFNYIAYTKYKGWWAKYAYVLSVALDVGVAFMAVLTIVALKNVYGIKWWGLDLDDHCPLAKCPTASGIVVDGCPVFS